jgi:flagellar biosynthesis protein FlhF
LTRAASTPAPRKFVAATGREALRRARESLGGGAMVLASRALGDGIEIVAIAEDAAAVLVDSAAPAHEGAPGESGGGPAPLPEAAALPVQTVLTELHSMRSMIEERLGSVAWNERQRRDPVRGRLLRTMLGAGFSARLSKAMLEQLPAGHTYAEGVAFVKSELLRTLPIREDEDALLAQGGVYALVGPTGVGKTTTTAKLAARCVMRFGADKLALVTTDGYRIGAYEQLRIYGQILNVPVYAVKDGANLQAVLQQLAHKHIVLIDTVGMSQRDRAVSDQIAMLCSAGRQVKRLLLLNAASHGDTLNEVVYAYQRADQANELAGCIFTKLDEAPSHGALLDTVIRHRLPVHYVSDGQKVPENLVTASRSRLVEHVLKPPAPGALFVCDPDLGQAEPADASSAVTTAQAQAERVRLQYQQLIRAMAHDAQEVAAAAAAMQDARVGFTAARALWAQAADPAIGHAAMERELSRLIRADVAAACDRHVLAVYGRARLDASEHGDSFELQSSLLLCDRRGEPIAAPNPWLAERGSVRAGERQMQRLCEQDFGKPVVHVLAKPPTADDMQRWSGRSWLARAAGSTVVVDPRSGDSNPLWRIEVEFGPPEAVTHHGKQAVRTEAETRIVRKCADGSEHPLRLVVRRVLAADSRRPLEQRFVLASVPDDVSALQVALWQDWASRADACVRVTGKGLALMGGIGELGDPVMTKRLLAAAQVATTAWRLSALDGERADRTRVLLAELAGRQVRPDRAMSTTVLYEGLAKLFHLLEALATDPGLANAASRSAA